MRIKKTAAFVTALAMSSAMFTPLIVTRAAGGELYVGVGKEYDTINAALDAVRNGDYGKPESEAERITINVDPGSYEEQIVFDDMHYITLQQTPGTEDEGRVNVSWYYCVGYCASNADLNGEYDPKLDWSLDETWKGYNDGDEEFPRYEIGQNMDGVSAISYYDTDGVLHENVPVKTGYLGDTGGMDKMAPLIVRSTSSDITVKDFNIVNSVTVMVTQGEKDAHLTPQYDRREGVATSYALPDRSALSICTEDTPEEYVDMNSYDPNGSYTPGQSAYLARSSRFNERSHALSLNGDRIIIENVRARGNQDSVYISNGRIYFKNCDLIGGTDYIYGDATAVFDNCLLGAAGMSDKDYGTTVTAANTDIKKPYGYLFYNCELYNVRDNTTTSQYGRPWGAAAQVTFYNTTIDDTAETGASPASIKDIGWSDMSASKKEEARFFEYGTVNRSGSPVDLSGRVVNTTAGMGTVLDEWQILEFNPRNYFAANGIYSEDWDPMGFGSQYLSVIDNELDSATINVPEGEETEVDLPVPSDENIEYKWVSDSANAVVNSDGTKITVTRPAAGEKPVSTSVTLYARDNTTGFGDKKIIPVTIEPTTDTENVFNIPVTINASATAVGNCDYNIEITLDGAVIKRQTVTIPSGKNTVSETIANIPSTAEGIDYDVSITSVSDDYTITDPDGGKTTVTGITGTDVPLEITAEMLVDDVIDTGITFTPSSTDYKTYDLIALAKDAGADSSITDSDIITVSYDLDVMAKPSKESYIDLVSTSPSSSFKNGALTSRYACFRLKNNWEQLDMADCADGMSGSDTTEHQWLNIAGKFDYKTTSHVETTINYKTGTISGAASGTNDYQSYKEYTFASFPEQAEKGSLYMAIYPGDTGYYTISNVKVRYKKLITDNKPVVTEKDTVAIDAGFDSKSDGFKSFDIYALAKSAGADSSIDKSDTVKVEYDLVVNKDMNTDGFIDLVCKTPSETFTQGVFADRYVLTKVNQSWDQLDMVDCTAYYSGSSSTSGQWLNISGKFDYDKKTSNHVSVTVDYKNRTVSAGGSGSGSYQGQSSYTFGAFPLAAEKGSMFMAVYPNSGEDYVMSNVKVTYDKIVEQPEPEVTPKPEETQEPEKTPDPEIPTMSPDGIYVDFTALDETPVYSAETGRGFVSQSSAIMPEGSERKVAPVSEITVDTDGASVTEDSGSYIVSSSTSAEGYNYGGLIYRADVGAPGAYRITVEIEGDSNNTRIAPTGMDSGRLTSTSAWDTAGLVSRETSAKWNGSVWSYDYATGDRFIEIEIEPTTCPTADAPQTVTVKKISITPIDVNAAGDKPTIHILGDSTQKTYTFNSPISAWGQTLAAYFDLDKVNVVNYSMGGRSMKANYTEGRTDDVLLRGKAGDFVFIHSAHNDETNTARDRFSRGTNFGTLEENNELYNRWLDFYVSAIKARGMTPVFVTAMPRTNKGAYTESAEKPNGFNPDAPGNMRAKAASDPEVGLIELYEGAKKYIDSVDDNEVLSIYNTLEAGETPADGVANGNTGDGTHYREAAAKQWSRIMLQSIYDQSVSNDDTYTDKDIMQELAGYMRADVEDAAASGDWTEVFPEMASDVSAVGIEPGAVPQAEENFYYRNAIEKTLQLGILHKDTNNLFHPTETITVGEFARAVEKAFGLDENSLSSYTKTYSELTSSETPEPSETAIPTEPVQTSTPTEPVQTNEPVKSLKVTTVDGKTVIETSGMESGVIIAAVKDASGTTAVKTAEITGDTVTIDGIEANEVYAWDSLETMIPLCNAYKADTIGIAESDTCTVNVVQPAEGGTVTVYDESSYNTYTVNIGNGIEPNQVISDNDYFTLAAPEVIVNKTDKGGVFDNDQITTDYIELHSSNNKLAVYTAKADGTLTAYMRFVGNKLITLENLTDSTKVQKYIDGSSMAGTSDNVYAALSFEVKAGNSYLFYSQGGTGRLFGINYASDYPSSQSSLTVSAGSVIRIKATADAYWLNDTITVDGESISTDKECTYTVNSDITVSAAFKENPEPKLVETTVIASDAALTREAMAAILYDAYLLKFGKDDTGAWNKPKYMTDYNGTVRPPDDPDYDPNITQDGSTQYYPNTGWAALTDLDEFDDSLYGKAKEVYNLGLMRTEQGIARGSIANGTQIEPKTEVTRAKAAKTLNFIYILTQPVNAESQVLPEGNLAATNAAPIDSPNPEAPSTPVK